MPRLTLTPAKLAAKRALGFTFLLLLVTLVDDGWTSHISTRQQILLLAFTCSFVATLYRFLCDRPLTRLQWSPQNAVWIAFVLEGLALVLHLYEALHMAKVGYRLRIIPTVLVFGTALVALALLAVRQAKTSLLFVTALGTNIAGLLLAIVSFPLTYLRSDMLPVILWSGTNLLRHISPYQTIYIADRTYDFPYLPGMLVAYLPFVALHLDLRFASIVYTAALATIVYLAAKKEFRLEVAALLALFLVCPFLQFRHDLYLQPHWVTLVGSFVLMQRRRFAWAALIFGFGMATYQFSWIMFPFILLHAFRRKGLLESVKISAGAAAGALLVVGPFLRSALDRMAHNTVGQWGTAAHAVAGGMNVSYWLTYLVRPDKLLPIQAALMILIFSYCVVTRRCSTLADTLRWIIAALTIFIMLNVLVDGYFYLMLLVVLLAYTCVTNEWWQAPDDTGLSERAR